MFINLKKMVKEVPFFSISNKSIVIFFIKTKCWRFIFRKYIEINILLDEKNKQPDFSKLKLDNIFYILHFHTSKMFFWTGIKSNFRTRSAG